jgi:hypothetical protein
MFEAYKIQPVLEWEGNDESRKLESFTTLGEATKAHARLMRDDPEPYFEARIFWTIYGVNPETSGIRTEEAVADRDSESAALELLSRIIGPFTETTCGDYVPARRSNLHPVGIASAKSTDVTLTLRIDLTKLKQQKRSLIEIRRDSPVTPLQEETVEGILNLIDFIQDSILEQGLATEDQIFAQSPFEGDQAALFA